MSAPLVVAVAPGSPADHAGLRPGDAVRRVNGRVPRDIIEWRLWSDEAVVGLEIARNGIDLELDVHKRAGEPLGAEVSSALFDRVRTCDNHCEFCFIYQLPKGLRRSLYLKDDDYRLSFLYGNFTTLTRFTESDLERVVTEGLSPLHVSIHSTDPDAAGPHAAQPARCDEPALAAGAARSRHRGARPARHLPRRQRRTSARRHPGRDPRRVPGAELGRRRAARDLPLQPGGGDAPAHARRRRRRSSTPSRTGRTSTAPPSGAGWSTPPTSTTSWPAGRSPRRTPTRASRCTRTASAWPARSSSSSAIGSPTPPGSGGASSPPPTPAAAPSGDVLPPNPAAYTGSARRPDDAGHPAGPAQRADRRPVRRARRPRSSGR